MNAVSKYEETVLIKKDHWVVDAKSLLGILAIALQPDQEIEIEVSAQNDQIVNELVELGLVAKV
ncbi:MAG: HPr family phosphocarrier protein [Bacillaceae bacterium]|nr:HPr family phosphocarrier protein [Bacillaceae bacterium]